MSVRAEGFSSGSPAVPFCDRLRRRLADEFNYPFYNPPRKYIMAKRRRDCKKTRRRRRRRKKNWHPQTLYDSVVDMFLLELFSLVVSQTPFSFLTLVSSAISRQISAFYLGNDYRKAETLNWIPSVR